MHPMLNIAIRAARKAGTLIIKSYENPNTIKINDNIKGALSTNIDMAVEQSLIDTIKKAYPDHTIITEQSGLIKGKEQDIQWIIDPIDGTLNLIKGIAHCAIAISVRVKDKTEVAAIYNPMSNELFTAIRGQGSQLNGYRLRVSDNKDLSGSILSIAFPSNTKKNSAVFFNVLNNLFSFCADFRSIGSTSLNLCNVAAARTDGLLELNVKPCSISAGELILRESGGILTDLTGSSDYFNTGNLIAGNPKIVKHLLTETMNNWTDNLK